MLNSQAHKLTCKWDKIQKTVDQSIYSFLKIKKIFTKQSLFTFYKNKLEELCESWVHSEH